MPGPELREIFCAALERDTPQEQGQYLDQACQGRPDLRAREDALLRANDEASRFLQEGSKPRAAADEPITERPGTLIGPYTLLEQIGEGGFGVVFLAEQSHPVRRKVALKVLKPGMDTRQVVARFEAERQALAIMDHPSIARVFDGGATASGRPFFVMEVVQGVPITQYCDEHHLTPKQRLRLFLRVCEAVQHAHQKGVIHRDLKPSNILVADQPDNPVLKVIDFGVAKAVGQQLTEKTIFTGSSQMIGTPLYMSPEQAGGGALDVDTRSDIYSLGVLLYELLTGETPIDRERLKKADLDEIRRLIRDENPPKPSTRLKKIAMAAGPIGAAKQARLMRGELDWIVMKALEKDRNRRYETANGLAMDLQRYLADERVLAGPPSASYRLRKFVWRNKGAVSAAAAIVLALAAGAVVSTWQAALAKESAARAVQQTAHALRAKQETKEKADIAVAINAFLKDLLNQADIRNQPLTANRSQRDPNVTVRELLDRSAQEIAGRFPDQPLIEAGLRQTIGNAYCSLGVYNQAERHLQRALELYSAKSGTDKNDTLAAKHDFATVYILQEKFDLAERLLEEAIAAHRPDDPKVMESQLHLAMVYGHEGKYDRAEPLSKEMVTLTTARLGPDHRVTLLSQNCLGELYRLQGKYNEAAAVFKQVLDVQTATLGRDHPDTLTSMNNLGLTYDSMAKYDLAEPLLKEAVATRIAKSGADHPDTLMTKSNLALLYEKQRKFGDAEAQLKEVIVGYAAKVGADRVPTLISKLNLARV